MLVGLSYFKFPCMIVFSFPYGIPVFSPSLSKACFKKWLIVGIYCNFNVTITDSCSLAEESGRR